MRLSQSVHYSNLYDQDSGAVFSDLEFRGCSFGSCVLSMAQQPSLRSTVKNVLIAGCSQRGCSINSAVIEDVVVDGLKTNGQLLRCSGAVFNRTVLRGKIDRVMLSNSVFPPILLADSERQARIDAFMIANVEYYKDVQWALDISQGEFSELCIRGLPGHLIRRDPETQILITRESALERRWQSLTYREPLYPTSLQGFLDRGDATLVLIAPKRHRKFHDYLADLKMLRNAKVADPD